MFHPPLPPNLFSRPTCMTGSSLLADKWTSRCLRVLQFILSVPSMTSLFWLQCEAGTENWQRVNTELPVKSPRFALFDLAEGKSYRFRVRCSNSAGVGEPSEATEVTVVGDKLGKCRVCLSCCKLIWLQFERKFKSKNRTEIHICSKVKMVTAFFIF